MAVLPPGSYKITGTLEAADGKKIPFTGTLAPAKRSRTLRERICGWLKRAA